MLEVTTSQLRLVAALVSVYLAPSLIAQSPSFERLLESRRSLPPFCGEYIEDIRVPGTAGEAQSWGKGNSRVSIIACVDATSSKLSYPNGKHSSTRIVQPSGAPELSDEDRSRILGGPLTYYFDGKRTFHTIEEGARGNVGSRASGLVNPAAAGYELFGMDVLLLGQKDADVRETNGGFRVLIDGTEIIAEVQNWPNQAAIRHDRTDYGYVTSETESTVRRWTSYKGYRYPAEVHFVFREDGRIFAEEIFTLTKVLPRSGPLSFAWKEGALFKDEDTQTVYWFMNGKAVPDESFNTTSRRQRTLESLKIIGIFAALGVWVAAWARGHTRRQSGTQEGV